MTFGRLRERLLAYDIYPRSALLYAITPFGRLASGSTIVQRLQLGLVAIEGGVRVVYVWDSETRSGFAYVTLEGHPDCGVEWFGVGLDADGRVRIEIQARSRPGQLLTWIGLPVARAVQVVLTRAALRRLAR